MAVRRRVRDILSFGFVELPPGKQAAGGETPDPAGDGGAIRLDLIDAPQAPAIAFQIGERHAGLLHLAEQLQVVQRGAYIDVVGLGTVAGRPRQFQVT
jgi:hypothetical protein